MCLTWVQRAVPCLGRILRPREGVVDTGWRSLPAIAPVSSHCKVLEGDQEQPGLCLNHSSQDQVGTNLGEKDSLNLSMKLPENWPRLGIGLPQNVLGRMLRARSRSKVKARQGRTS
jgi:hypothetical protein